MSTDIAQLGVIKAGLDALTREMAVNLRRSAISSIVREARDFSVALTDPKGEVVAQAECIPIMTAGISIALQEVAKVIDLSSLDRGDAILMNDPYSGGQHLQDIYLFTPIFTEDNTLVAFGASTAHHVDLGGSHAGLSAHATEIFQEGLRLAPARFSVARDFDDPHGFVRQVIAANVRVPDAVIGDLQAQFAASNTAERRLLELMERHGARTCLDAMEFLKDHSEFRVRDAVSRIPDGVYTATEHLETSAFGGGEVDIHARVTVDGTNIDVDLSGSAVQVLGNINCPFASTVSAVQSAVRCMLDVPDIGFNEGCNRVLTVSASHGSILNPRFPAAVRARLTPASRVFNAVIRALGEALPERAVATGFDTTTAIAVSNLSPDGVYEVALEILGGGWGGCADHDGADALDNPISNCANAPIEALETDYGHFEIDEYSLLRGSAGDGKFRGGHGIRRIYRATRDGVRVSGYADRHERGPQGFQGGEDGGTGSFHVERVDGTHEVLPHVYEAILNCGDRIVIQTGGGGGYKPAQDRDAALRDRDKRFDLI
ncbi:hydantoinase B/oxoprolinase family protein [Nocardioides sp. NPDC004968]|uniref:hydantoinase B/oxoprolinase family protein n=1 Tax=Nocardioides sp. NPDC004968 TaxID=3155894 RepID=UPI0033B238CB